MALAESAESTASQTSAASPARFTISSFNVLGSRHTPARGERSGPNRIRSAVKLIDRHGVDVVGLQELESNQASAFMRATRGRFKLFPGNSMTKPDSANSIGWRTGQWQLVKATTMKSPYFNGTMRPMPVIKLRNRATGIQAWFANFHNPATTKNHPNQERHRARATTMQVDLANRLHRSGLPVFITGDMNEREKYFCRMTGGAPMKSASGGSHRDGKCRPPDRPKIDWIFGSRQRVDFHGYVEDRSPLVQKTTDHHMIVSKVRAYRR